MKASVSLACLQAPRGRDEKGDRLRSRSWFSSCCRAPAKNSKEAKDPQSKPAPPRCYKSMSTRTGPFVFYLIVFS